MRALVVECPHCHQDFEIQDSAMFARAKMMRSLMSNGYSMREVGRQFGYKNPQNVKYQIEKLEQAERRIVQVSMEEIKE